MVDAIASALGEMGATEAIPHLVARLRWDGRDTTLRGLAKVLRQLGPTLAVAEMIEQLESSDSDTWQRARAADALGELGDMEAVPPLTKALKDPDELVRQSAARALGVLGPLAYEALADLLNDEAPAVRREAVYALSNTGGTQVTPLLERALDDEYTAVRQAAERELERLRQPQDGETNDSGGRGGEAQ